MVEVTTVKRQLPTTVSSPERSPAVKKVLKVTEIDVPSGRESTAKKSLFGKENVESDSASTSGRQVGTTIDPLLSALNVDSLLEKKKTTQVKVITVLPSGLVKTYESFDHMTKSLIINASQKNLNAVANIIFKHRMLKVELLNPLMKKVSAEFKDYCTRSDESESMLKQCHPTELETFSNKLFLEEVRLSCPYWMSCLLSACKVSSYGDKSIQQLNAMALYLQQLLRIVEMSAIAYRLSVILFHCGVKFQDVLRLHKLGVCMSPQMILKMEWKMGGSCGRKRYKKVSLQNYYSER